MSTPSVGIMGQQGGQNTTGVDPWCTVDMDDFVKLLVTELRNQDPMEPMSNQEILQQISQIREIESNSRLTETLESVLLGQNVATAGNLMGQLVKGLSDAGERVAGRVDRVSIDDGVAQVHVGEQMLALKNVSEILPEGAELEETDPVAETEN